MYVEANFLSALERSPGSGPVEITKWEFSVALSACWSRLTNPSGVIVLISSMTKDSYVPGLWACANRLLVDAPYLE